MTIQNLKEIFIALDVNQDGTLTLKEIQDGLSKLDNCNIDIEEVFNSIDTDRSGVINYTEFLAATIDKSLYLQEEKLIQAFKVLDKDSSGKISLKEIKYG
jgi:calcium-dependent protein kinase